MNKVILVGKLSHAPLKKTSLKGNTIIELHIELCDKEKQQTQNTIIVNLWGKLAKIAQTNFSQHDIISIEGFLQMDKWIDKEKQQQRSFLRIIAERVRLVIKH